MREPASSRQGMFADSVAVGRPVTVGIESDAGWQQPAVIWKI
jgi:hypothetical protein